MTLYCLMLKSGFSVVVSALSIPPVLTSVALSSPPPSFGFDPACRQRDRRNRFQASVPEPRRGKASFKVDQTTSLETSVKEALVLSALLVVGAALGYLALAELAGARP